MTSRTESHVWISRRRRRLSRALVAGAVLLAAAPAVRSQDVPTFTECVLYTFTGGTDGGLPYAGLAIDQKGNLYGTTAEGGDLSKSCFYAGCGVVFKVDPSGKETVRYTFTGGTDGGSVFYDSTLIRDEDGNLYGTTGAGGDMSACYGSGCGVVFRVDPAGKETVLYAFTGGTDGGIDGYSPGLVRDESGNLYGITFAGGDLSAHGGVGVVFKLADLVSAGGGSSWMETVLYSFTGGADGGYPDFGPLVRDRAGNLYGTTSAFGIVGGSFGWGTVFKLDPQGKITVLHTFTGGADGGEPFTGLIGDDEGNLYGTTGAGGDLSGCPGPYISGCGVAFKIDPSGKETVLHAFTGGADGSGPYGRLLRGPNGDLYGTTFLGGNLTATQCAPSGCGVVYRIDPAGKETVLYTFTGEADGGGPYAGLVSDQEGNLYSTTLFGGDLSATACYGCGVVFKLTRSAAGSQ